MGRRTDIDWDPIKRDYEADLLTGDELATRYGVERTSILRRAKKEGWSKNLQARVKERTEAKLVTAAAPAGKQQSDRKATNEAPNPAASKPSRAKASSLPAQSTEEEAIEVAATANVQVILGHRTDITRARRITDRLWAEAEAQFDDVAKVLPMLAGAEITVGDKKLGPADLLRIQTAIARARDLPTRTATVKGLTEAMRLQQALERQAFGIDKADGGGEGDSLDFRQRLINARNRARDSSTEPASR